MQVQALSLLVYTHMFIIQFLQYQNTYIECCSIFRKLHLVINYSTSYSVYIVDILSCNLKQATVVPYFWVRLALIQIIRHTH